MIKRDGYLALSTTNELATIWRQSMRQQRQKIGAIFILVGSLCGCVSTQPFPIAARPGDTVLMALGSQDDVNKTNVSVKLTDATGKNFTFSPKSVFNLYPDKRSMIYDENSGISTPFGTGHEQWLTVMAFNVPSGVAPGMATLNVSTTGVETRGSNISIQKLGYPLEILNGQGAAHKLQGVGVDTIWGRSIVHTGTFAKLEPIQKQVYIKPPGTYCSVGAIDFRFQLPFTIEPYQDHQRIRIVADDFSAKMFGAKPSEVTWSARGNELRIILTNSGGYLQCSDARFSIVPKLGTGGASFTTAPILVSVTYFDGNGSAVAGPDPSQYLVTLK